ncbi:MAG TPA: hypothetical protein VIL37_06575 [Natronosporangium sp.]
MTDETRWLREYVELALDLDRTVSGEGGGSLVVYTGPEQWRQAVAERPPRSPAALVDQAEALAATVPFDGQRRRYLTATLRAIRAVAAHHRGDRVDPYRYAELVLGIAAGWVPEGDLLAGHDLLDAALPAGPGSLGERLRRWQQAHLLPADRLDQLPELVLAADAEARRRTEPIVALPAAERIGCELVTGTHFLAAGQYHGDLRSTILVNRDVPANLADLLYVVCHEGHPGHIAEAVLKDRQLVGEQGRLEHQLRFLLSPEFVVSEGLGLVAEELVFPGDQAQRWLTDQLAPKLDRGPITGDLARIHEAKNLLWGAWANAATLASQGRAGAEIAGYLQRYALLDDQETAAALGSLRAPGMHLYTHAYYHGYRLVRGFIAPHTPGWQRRARQLLTEPNLPADLAPPQPAS